MCSAQRAKSLWAEDFNAVRGAGGMAAEAMIEGELSLAHPM
jgi:hypothetical protein